VGIGDVRYSGCWVFKMSLYLSVIDIVNPLYPGFISVRKVGTKKKESLTELDSGDWFIRKPTKY
jgi:hypothetical protein